MKRYLKVIEHSESLYNEAFRAIVISGSNVVIPAIKSEDGIFVEATKENEKDLMTANCCYMVGTLEMEGNDIRFNCVPPFNFIQLFLRDIDQIPVNWDALGISMQKVYENTKEYIDVLSKVVGEALSGVQAKIMAVPVFSNERGYFYFDLYQVKSGYARGVHVVHSKSGITRIAVRKNHRDQSVVIALEPKFTLFSVEGNPQVRR